MEQRFHSHHTTPPKIELPNARIPSELDEYLFDLNGFVIIRGALSQGAQQVAVEVKRRQEMPGPGEIQGHAPCAGAHVEYAHGIGADPGAL